MKVEKVLILGLIFMIVSVYWFGVPSNVSAEESELITQVVAQGTPSVQPRSLDCKYEETKDKSGNVIYKLVGKDCEKLVKEMNEPKTRRRVCCQCDLEGSFYICRGIPPNPCCPMTMKEAGIKSK